MDEFIKTRPDSQSVHLIFTTRSAAKSKATLGLLHDYIDHHASLRNASDRIDLSSYEVDITNLKAVIELAKTLDKAYPYLSAIICNAGIMGAIGVHWGQAIWKVITDPIQSVTWPTYNNHSLRRLAKPQLDTGMDVSAEPALGEVFTANVFGHYILAAHLMPLFSRVPPSAGPARIIWQSSIETYAAAFSLDDIQCLDRREAYSSSKRLTDLLVLTSHLSATQPLVRNFYDNVAPQPTLYLGHPGVASTEIFALPPLARWGKVIGFYFARLLGSPWHTISPYKGAASVCWLALSPTSTIQSIEERYGKGKWGSATDMFGADRIMRTEVEGWGYGGVIGSERQFGPKGRRRGAVDLTEEQREAFEKLGVQVWEEMELLRREWEQRLDA